MTPPPRRNTAIDVVRGLVIVLMALDHVRGFFQPVGLGPTDLESTSPGFFFMRWITHLCAPLFVVLMGAGAGLRHSRRPQETARWLWTRGLWLIFLESTWVTFAWYWDPLQTYWGVLFALGGSMVLLALVHRLPPKLLLGLGLAITVLLAVLPITRDTPGVGVWLQPSQLTPFGHRIGVSYVLIPWFAVAAMGFGVARWLVQGRARAHLWVGLGMVGLAVLLRWFQLGDPSPWAVHERGPAITLLSFMNFSKYPPSLDFLLATLGLGLAMLGSIARGHTPVHSWLATLGRVPLFFYLVHLPFAHLAGNGFALLVHGGLRIPAGTPLSLPLILGAWVAVTAALTPVCVYWDRLKRRRKDLAWLAYF